MPDNHNPVLIEERFTGGSGGLVSLHDEYDPASSDPAGERWLVICVVHGTPARFAVMDEAQQALAHPGEFCPDCGALVQAKAEVAARPDDASLAPHERVERVRARAAELLGRPLR